MHWARGLAQHKYKEKQERKYLFFITLTVQTYYNQITPNL